MKAAEPMSSGAASNALARRFQHGRFQCSEGDLAVGLAERDEAHRGVDEIGRRAVHIERQGEFQVDLMHAAAYPGGDG